MKITFIRPRIGILDNGDRCDRVSMEPLNIAVLAGMTPGDIEIEFFDDRREQIEYARPTDLVAITVETFTARRAYEISEEYERRGVKVIMGGVHPTLATAEVAQYADSVYVGDAERQWADVIADLRQGKLRPLYNSDGAADIQPSMPRRDIFDGKGYLPFYLCQFSRGCPHHCTFCTVGVYFGHRHKCRRCEDVLRELRQRPHDRIPFFVDDNLTANPGQAKQLLRELATLHMHWVCQLGMDVAGDDELLELLKKSGCLGFVVGFESINKSNLESMEKTANLHDFRRYGPQVRKLREYGFHIWAAFMVGHDNDTPSSLEEMASFAIDNRFAFAAFNTVTPYPGTPLYERLKQEKRLLYDGAWWLHPEYRYNYAAFTPKHMSADQLTDFAFRIRKQFNSFRSLGGRAIEVLGRGGGSLVLGLVLRYGVFFRSEIRRKQGMRLG